MNEFVSCVFSKEECGGWVVGRFWGVGGVWRGNVVSCEGRQCTEVCGRGCGLVCISGFHEVDSAGGALGDVSSRLLHMVEAEQPTGAALPVHLDLLCAMEKIEPKPREDGLSTGHMAGHEGDSARVAGSTQKHSVITRLARETFAALPPWAQKATSSWISGIGASGLRVASIFSGSDFGRTAIEAYLQCARPAHYPQPVVHHVMAVEHISWKQQWLRTVFPPQVLPLLTNSCSASI